MTAHLIAFVFQNLSNIIYRHGKSFCDLEENIRRSALTVNHKGGSLPPDRDTVGNYPAVAMPGWATIREAAPDYVHDLAAWGYPLPASPAERMSQPRTPGRRRDREERLSFKRRVQMEKTNVFADQATFMRACGQTTQGWNEDQFRMYLTLIQEEFAELCEAVDESNRTEIFDALLDLIVVTIGAGLSAGFPMAAGWQEVMTSNLGKIDTVTGMVLRREDGKILKGPNWQPPKLADLLG